MTIHERLFGLNAADLAMFAAICVPEDRLRAAGIRRVTHQQAREDCGIQYKSPHLEGLAFPYRLPTNGARPVTWRVRRDHPDVHPDGKPIAKYVSPPDRKHLYFPVEADGSLLVDTHSPVVVVEAEKSVLSVMQAFATEQRHGLALGTGGCWGWRGRIGKTTSASGATVDERGPLPDLDLVTWASRRVYVCFDTNTATNSKVQAARKALMTALRDRGADVIAIDLPVEPGINGPDDHIGRHGAAAFLARLDSATAPDDHDRASAQKRSQATQLVDLALATGVELWHSPRQEPYATIRVGDHREHHQLKRAVHDHLTLRYFERYRRAPSGGALADALGVLAGMAREGTEHPVSVRLASTATAVYLDLGDRSWQAIEITAEGWRLVANPPVRLWRPSSLRPLPRPVPGTLDSLRELWPLDDDAWTLSASWLVASAAPSGPYPILLEAGEAGSGKSTFGRMLRGVIDPASPALRGVPRDERDVMIGALLSHVVALDNLSGLPPWLSDALCRIATGGGFATRMLYSDLDETLIDVARPILLTGIESPATRGDLLDRALVVTLPALSDEPDGDDDALWLRYDQARPGVLGALCEAVSVALRRRAGVKLARRQRMANACVWVTAAEPALGWRTGRTAETWTAARMHSSADLIAGDPFSEAVRSMDRPWYGTAADLLAKLAGSLPAHVRTSRAWPKTPQAVGGLLTRLAPDLRRVGVDIARPPRTHGGVRPYEIRDAMSPTSPTSPSGDFWPDPYQSRVTYGDEAPERPPAHVTTNRGDSGPIPSEGDDGDNGDD